MDSTSIYNWMSILNLILLIAFLGGGIIAFRQGFTRTANEVQERVISALQAEINTLKDQIGELKSRLHELEMLNIRLRMIISAIVSAMKRRKIAIDIEQDFIRIVDEQSGKDEQVAIHEHTSHDGLPS